MRVLVISAHPDDETIGAGGTLLRHLERGDEVHWAICTQAHEPAWSKEVIDAARMQVDRVGDAYGMTSVHRLGFPTVMLNTVPYMDLSSALTKVVKLVQPEVVYTLPRGDINQDHRLVHDATLVACRPLPGTSVKTVLSYEIGPTTRYGQPSGAEPFRPCVFVDITSQLPRKLEIMALYIDEIREFPHPRSLEGLELIAKERGLSVGLKAAEAFELVREIR
ncbi:MAG: PIG-L family deacetylase [Myxococcales bacterium]|nr:PIG-L family deacetylase [Myxococcales bacterium]